MISRMYRELVYDLKEPGIHIWMIPLVALVFIVMTFFVQKALDLSGNSNELTLPMLGALIPTLGGYGALMLMQSLFETEGGELVFTWPRTRLYWGLIRQLRFFTLYALWVAVVCLLVCIIVHSPFSSTFRLTLAQCFAVMGVAFFGTTASKKEGVGLIIMVAFVGIQLVMGGYILGLNWIYDLGRGSFMPASALSGSLELNALIIGVFSWFMGQVWLRPPR